MCSSRLYATYWWINAGWTQAGSHGDKAKLDEMTTRVKSLEKQRVDLIDAFKKQMKLIDVLKRQKVCVKHRYL